MTEYAFGGCGDIKYITLPNTMVTLESESIAEPNLIEIIIPGSVKTIGDAAFINGSNLNVVIGNGVTSIGESVFSACNDLTINLTSNVTMDAPVFNNSQGLNITFNYGFEIINSDMFYSDTDSMPSLGEVTFEDIIPPSFGNNEAFIAQVISEAEAIYVPNESCIEPYINALLEVFDNGNDENYQANIELYRPIFEELTSKSLN